MQDIIQRLKSEVSGSRLRPMTAEKMAEIRGKYPGVPADYLLLLSELGYGSMGESSFMIYSGLVSPASIFGKVEGKVAAVLLVGDDFAGGHVGYDTSTMPWRLVSFDHCDLDGFVEPADTLLGFLSKRFLDAA